MRFLTPVNIKRRATRDSLKSCSTEVGSISSKLLGSSLSCENIDPDSFFQKCYHVHIIPNHASRGIIRCSFGRMSAYLVARQWQQAHGRQKRNHTLYCALLVRVRRPTLYENRSHGIDDLGIDRHTWNRNIHTYKSPPGVKENKTPDISGSHPVERRRLTVLDLLMRR